MTTGDGVGGPTPVLRPRDQSAGDTGLDLHAYPRMLRRRWRPALAALSLVLTGVAAVTLVEGERYEARTRLFVGQQAISRPDLPFAQELTQASLSLVKSYAVAIRSRPIAEDALSDLRLADDPEDVLDRVEAEPVDETQIIELRYRDLDPGRARRVANAMARSFIDELERIDPQREAELGVRVTVLEEAAEPDAPVSPDVRRRAVIGLLLGAIAAWGAVLVAERADPTVQNVKDAEEVSGLPVLAQIPSARVPEGRLPDARGTPAAEAFRLLRAELAVLADRRRLRTLAVTSPDARDGRTTVAMNLAAAYAEAGRKTVLVEADMRGPSVATDLEPGNGSLSAYLQGGEGRGLHRTDRERLMVIPAGPQPADPPELLGGERMRALVAEFSDGDGTVVLDTPPVLRVSDVVALTPMLDGILLVARAGSTRRERLREAVRVLTGVGAPVMGIVLNGVSGDGSG